MPSQSIGGKRRALRYPQPDLLREVLAFGADGVADDLVAVASSPRGTPLPANLVGPRMSRLRREHHRLLGNGYCTRPPELDCAFESICETCTFFQTSIEFRPTLQRQRDHAADHEQHHRADLFDRLLTRIDQQAS